VHVTLADLELAVDFGGPRRVLSSAVLGGGLGSAAAWLNVTVPADYARTDPAADLSERVARLRLPGPVVAMMTAVDVRAHRRSASGAATAVATVGVGHALAAAGRLPRAVPAVGTINLLVLVDAPLDDAALAGAAQTAIEAKAQALADAGVRAANAPGHATGTATDAFCIAALPGGGVPFAGPVTRVGADIARAVHEAVLAGALADRTAREAAGPAGATGALGVAGEVGAASAASAAGAASAAVDRSPR
jgi:adenosylcobinamide amidohydrolase